MNIQQQIRRPSKRMAPKTEPMTMPAIWPPLNPAAFIVAPPDAPAVAVGEAVPVVKSGCMDEYVGSVTP